MEETITKQSIKIVLFSELLKINVEEGIHRHNYSIPVKRSNDPRCVYNLFSNMDNIGIFISMQKNNNAHRGSFGQSIVSFFSGSDSANHIELKMYELEPKHEHWKEKFDVPEIELLIDESVTVSSVQNKSDRHWNDDHIIIKGTKNAFKVNMPRSLAKRPILVEKNGIFYQDRYGVLFDVVKSYIEKYNHYGKFTEHTIFEMFKRFNVIYSDRDQKNRFLLSLLDQYEIKLDVDKAKMEGTIKTFSSIQSFYEDMLNDKKDILSMLAFKFAADASKRTIKNVKFSVVFNKLFSGIDNKNAFDAKVLEMSAALEKEVEIYNSDTPYGDRKEYHEILMDSLPEAREIKKAALKRKSTGAINKIMDDLDFISISKEDHPITHEAIFSGEIPKGTFFRKNGDSYFVFNDNWALWEEMLKKHKEAAIAIATEASRRTTFEKDLMSYFYFILHKLPEYLNKHTGRKWKCIPKLVSAEKELEPPTEGSNGVAKQRSALTPIVDNEKNEVVVPYVSMRLSGYQTSYCYGLDYNVLEKGMSFKGNVVTNEIEHKLNGRDHYGLMFYTLTGSASAQGYPTFLIIFEDLEKTVKVHFHRTHPMRTKAGEYNPIHGWIKGCYKWMVGNVNFERIKSQQGDLVFVEIEDPGPGLYKHVNGYDSHTFGSPVMFKEYDKKEKSNILGYFFIEKGTMLNHPEHMPRLIKKGHYELRQCRSWEANPKGVWSLRID